jgi:hypothetical protein
MAKGLLAILAAPKGKGGMGPKGPPPESDEYEEETEDSGSALVAEMKSAAAEQDWDGFAEAAAAYVKSCMGK